MRRGASYLYCFPTKKLTGADFTLGRNIILFYSFYCWLFTPRFTLFFLGFVWMITTISSTPEGGQYKFNKNSFWSCTNSNTPSQQGRYSSVFISITIIWVSSILSLSSVNLLKVVFMNLFYPDVWENLSCYLSISTTDGILPHLDRDIGWENVYKHLLHVCLIYWWGTPIPG